MTLHTPPTQEFDESRDLPPGSPFQEDFPGTLRCCLGVLVSRGRFSHCETNPKRVLQGRGPSLSTHRIFFADDLAASTLPLRPPVGRDMHDHRALNSSVRSFPTPSASCLAFFGPRVSFSAIALPPFSPESVKTNMSLLLSFPLGARRPRWNLSGAWTPLFS